MRPERPDQAVPGDFGSPSPEVREKFITLLPSPGESTGLFLERVEIALEEAPGELLELRAFASHEAFPEIQSHLSSISGAEEWPISLLDGEPHSGGGIAGIQLHLLEGAPVKTIRLEGDVVGRAFQDSSAQYCVLGGIAAKKLEALPEDQASEAILRMDKALQSQGMGLLDLTRTWFFLDDILGWYGAFNRARTAIFENRGVFQGYVPASTGIGARNHLGAAVMASAMAMKPLKEGITVDEIPSPLQCPAGSYGSSFSRAAELKGPGVQRVFVSGTASIDPDGNTAHLGDVEAQIGLTFRVVDAILQSRGMGFNHVVRGNAYFKDVGYAPLLTPKMVEYGLQETRIVVSQNAVCRDDLLFEMEVEGVRPSR